MRYSTAITLCYKVDHCAAEQHRGSVYSQCLDASKLLTRRCMLLHSTRSPEYLQITAKGLTCQHDSKGNMSATCQDRYEPSPAAWLAELRMDPCLLTSCLELTVNTAAAQPPKPPGACSKHHGGIQSIFGVSCKAPGLARAGTSLAVYVG